MMVCDEHARHNGTVQFNMFHIPYINHMYAFFEETTGALGFFIGINYLHKSKCFYWYLLKNCIQRSCVYTVVHMGNYCHLDGSCVELDTLYTGISFWKYYRPSSGLIMVPVFPSLYLIPLVMINPFAKAAPLLCPENWRGCRPLTQCFISFYG